MLVFQSKPHPPPLTLLLATGAGVVEVQGLAGGLVTRLDQLHPHTGPGVTMLDVITKCRVYRDEGIDETVYLAVGGAARGE